MRLFLILASAALSGAMIQPAAAATDMLPPAVAAPSASEDVAPVDPALLPKARIIAAAILPDGTMARLFGPMMQKMMAPMTDSFTKLPIQELLKIGGMDPAEAAKLPPSTIDQLLRITDPAFKQRMQIMMGTLFPEMGKLMGQFEPDMREGMAEAFATRYSDAELNDITAFLKTPTGAKFGAGFMQLATDPHYLARAQAMMPKMMAAFPEMMRPAIAAIEKLPKPRKYQDLSPAERDQIAKLLGLDPKKMQK